MFQFSKLLEGRKATRRPSGKSAGLHTRLGFEPLERRELLSATMPSLLPQIDVSSQAAVAKTTGPSRTTTQKRRFRVLPLRQPGCRPRGEPDRRAGPRRGWKRRGCGLPVDGGEGQWRRFPGSGHDGHRRLRFVHLESECEEPIQESLWWSAAELRLDVGHFIRCVSHGFQRRHVHHQCDQRGFGHLHRGRGPIDLREPVARRKNPVEIALQQAIIANVPIGGTSAG